MEDIALMANLPLQDGAVDLTRIDRLNRWGIHWFCLDKKANEQISDIALIRAVQAIKREDPKFALAVEIEDTCRLGSVGGLADMIHISGIENAPLLAGVKEGSKPVLLGRGGSATIAEWLTAADALQAQGNRVVLCEDGIRTFSKEKTLDISSIPAIKELTSFPVLLRPDCTAMPDIREKMALAGIAAGADGLILKWDIDRLPEFLRRIKAVAGAVNCSFRV